MVSILHLLFFVDFPIQFSAKVIDSMRIIAMFVLLTVHETGRKYSACFIFICYRLTSESRNIQYNFILSRSENTLLAVDKYHLFLLLLLLLLLFLTPPPLADRQIDR